MATTEARPAASTLESFNPATGELVGSVATITPDEVQGVVDDVGRIQPAWAELTLGDRAAYLRRAAAALLDDIDEIAELLVNEQGKLRTEAYTMELLPTVDALHWCAKAGPKILADEKVRMSQPILMSKKSRFSYEPIGVVGVIAPSNYPWSIPFGEVAIALMAGNGVEIKPASLTPCSGRRSGGCSRGRAAGGPGAGRPRRRRGRRRARQLERRQGLFHRLGRDRPQGRRGLRPRLKGSVLELGGKDPMIVCADADLENAVSGAVWGGFANAGQTCSGIERVYVVRQIADVRRGRRRRGRAAAPRRPAAVGDRDRPDDLRRPVRDRLDLVEDAVASGATKLCGGATEVAGLPGKFVAPTVLTGSPTRCGSCARRSSARSC